MKKLITLLLFLTVNTLFAQDNMFIHTVTAANSGGNVTYLDHPDLNNNPDAEIIISRTWSGFYNDKVVGLWYSGSNWAVFNEDSSDMIEGVKFVIYIANPTNVITHIASVANQGSIPGITVIDDVRLNDNDPGPIAVMCNYWNPNSVYNNINYGFFYDWELQRRMIYSENGLDIPVDAAFKILITGDGNADQIEHETTAANTSSNLTVIDHVSLNGNPDAIFIFSHYWGVNGAGSEVHINKVLSSYYDGSNWGIYTEDLSDITSGVAFDIILAPQHFLGIESVVAENFEAYPNPTSNIVNIRTATTIEKVLLFDMLGKQIVELSGTGNTMQIDLSLYQPGTYLAKVQAGSQVKTLKLIKQ